MSDRKKVDLDELEGLDFDMEYSDSSEDEVNIDDIGDIDLGDIDNIEDDTEEAEYHDNTLFDDIDAMMDDDMQEDNPDQGIDNISDDELFDFDSDDEHTDNQVQYEEPKHAVDSAEEDVLGFDDELDISDIDMEDFNDKPSSTDSESEDIDAEIARLTKELGDASDDVLYEMDKINESGRFDDEPEDLDDDSDTLDTSILMDDDDGYEIPSRDNDFISPTGDIVVMDPTDSEDNFKLIYVDIENIAIVKRIRSTNNVDDLVKSIKSTGLLKPVDVAPASAEGIYVLLDGYRRILACARAGKRRIPCVVNTRVNVPEIPILEAMYNHSKKYSIKEMIDYIDYLEKQKGIMSASMIEYLLQMNSGEYTKLKDILNDNDDDIVTKLMDGIFTIEQAFKKLEQRRKKESAEVKDLKKATKVYEEDPESGAEMIVDSGETAEGEELTEAEIDSLAINANNFQDADNESLEELVEASSNMEGFKPKKQDPKYRERLDADVRKAILARDNNTCQICEQISGMEFTEVLDVHHIHEVYLGGNDAVDNLITACTVCHKLVHLHARGELHMRKIEQMSESEQKRFKRILTLGNKIRADMKVKGMKVDQLKKMDNASTIGRTKPGTGQEAG